MSAVRFDIIASALQTATGQGGAIPVIGLKEMLVTVDLTAHTTLTRLDVYLQASSDGGTTWYDIACNTMLPHSAAAAGGTSVSSGRNILNAITASPAKAIGQFHFPFGDLIRAAWVLVGTDVTFSVKAVGK